MFGACHYNFRFFCVERELMPPCIMIHDIECSLQATRRVGEQVCIIRNTDNRGNPKTDRETKTRSTQREETGIDVGLEVSTCTDMALPISFKFLKSPTEFTVEFDMTLCIFIGILAVCQQAIPFPN